MKIYNEQRHLIKSFVCNDGFCLHFIHSINLTPVDEYFSISTDGSLVLEKVGFCQFGTGTPSTAEEGVIVEDGRFVTKPKTILKEIALRVSPVPGHELIINGETIELTSFAPVGGLLVFRAGR